MGNLHSHFRRCAYLALLLLCSQPPESARAHGGHVLLRNDLTPGAYAHFEVSIRGVRRTPKRPHQEELSFEQSGRLTLLVLRSSGDKKKTASRAWMMQLDDPVVTSLTRGGQPVADLPHPKMVGLPPRVVQLHVSEIDSANANATAVGGSRVQRAGMLLALDFAHWPADVVSPDTQWETPSARVELEGVWKHRYARTEGSRAERHAAGSFEFEGKLGGPFARVASIKSARGNWRWRVSKRSLESVNSTVVLAYGPDEQRRTLELNVQLKNTKRKRFRKEELKVARDEIKPLTVMARDVLQLGSEDAKAKLQAFVDENPESLWLPVAKDVLLRAELEARTIAVMDDDQLVDFLVVLVRRWQAAAGRDEVEKLEPVRATYRELMESNGDALMQLTRSEEANIRAMSGFAVAFGKQAEHLARVIELTRDDEARVRAWATYGLAERREAVGTPGVLLRLLEDADRNVRIRACMATGACVGPEDPERGKITKRLLQLVGSEKEEQVIVRAAQALSEMAIAADLTILIDAEAECETPPARRILESTIRKLGGEPKDPLDD